MEWTAADCHGNRELQGMPEELVRSFSKRTGQIDTELDRLISDGRERTPRMVKWAVHATRKPKQHETPDTLCGRWRREAAERGHDPDALVRQVTGRTANRDQDQTVSEEVTGHLFDGLAGAEGLTATASTFTRPDVLVALGACGLPGARRTEPGGAGGPVPGRAGGQRGRRPGPGGAPLVHPRPAGGRAAAGHQHHRPAWRREELVAAAVEPAKVASIRDALMNYDGIWKTRSQTLSTCAASTAKCSKHGKPARRLFIGSSACYCLAC